MDEKNIEGTVKWFSFEKGYGFITKGEVDRYFNVRDVKGADLPSTGDSVRFDSINTTKGLRATNVVITNKKGSLKDDRVQCIHCGKTMIPRIIFYNGEPSKSICPFCAGDMTRKLK